MTRNCTLFSVAAITCLVAGLDLYMSVRADDRYVTDSFEIMVRSGPNLENKIIKVLRSGSKVDVIDDDAGEGYAEIRMDSGETGFVLSRLLTVEAAARARLAELQRTLDELQSDPASLEAGLVRARDKNSELVLENTDMSLRVQEMSEELARVQAASENAISNANERQKLQVELDALILEYDQMRLHNQALTDQSDKKWFIVGALTLLGGIIVGLIIPALRRKRQNPWSRY